MANKYASVVQSGVNNYLTSAETLNGPNTDNILPGVVGRTVNTAGVAPATGSFAVNAQGSPNMTVAVSAGQAYVSATPTSGSAQTVRVTSDASENVTIAANSTGSTRYDFLYIKVDPDKMNNPAVTGTDVVTLIVQRSTAITSDSNGTPSNSLLLAIVTVANSAASIANASIQDVRIQQSFSGADWTSTNETWTYASATTITVPTDATFKYSVGDKIRLVQSGAVAYFYITGVAATVLTISGGTDYTLANATILQPCYSKHSTAQGFPQTFSFTPSWTNFAVGTGGNATNVGKFWMTGKVVGYRVFARLGSSGASVGSGAYFAPPVTASTNYFVGGAGIGTHTVGHGQMTDNATLAYEATVKAQAASQFQIWHNLSNSTYVTPQATASNQPFTWAADDYLAFSGSYEAA